MARAMPRIAGLLCGFAVFALFAMSGTYILNPFGAASFDPRERIVGYGIHRVLGAGMAPVIEAGEIVFSDVGYYRKHEPRRGEVVVLRVPGRGTRVIKRIVGLPGETVSISHGSIEIDGMKLPEPHVAATAATTPYSREMAPFLVPRDAYFVLGDNRDGSEDSRAWGAVAHSDLQARVLGR